MTQITRLGSLCAVAVFGVCLILGCNQKPSDGTTTETKPADAANSPNNSAVSKAAADFLDAVLKGDTQRASARLTPQAMQRIIASGKQFSPPGLDTATFRIGNVRAPAKGQALVQCVLTDTSAGDAPRSEEMCCLLRLVDNDWRVSGIAYGAGPNQPWTLSDFETGQSTTIPRQPSRPGATRPQAPTAANGTTSPTRMAQEPAASSLR